MRAVDGHVQLLGISARDAEGTECRRQVAHALQQPRVQHAPYDVGVELRGLGRQRLRALAIAVAQLHRAGFSHGDLRPGNVLAKQDAQGNWHWAYLDNERTQQHRRLPMKLRKKNLVQLNMLRSPNLTRRDRLFFFLCYGQHFPDIDQRKLLSRITNTTRQRLDRLVRRGRLSAEEAAL